MKVLIIIPAYNEEKNILKVCRNIENNDIKYDYVVINDGSTDKTAEICNENELNSVKLIYNLGIGGAVQTGYKYAYENGYDIAVQFDGDGQHDIKYVDKLCENIKNGNSNMVIGSRYIKGSKSDFQSTAMRRLGKNMIMLFIKLLTGKRITDPTSGFRAIDKKILREFVSEYPTDYPEPESTFIMLRKGYKVMEVPVNMNEREHGVSSINIFKSMHYMLKVLIAIVIDSINIKETKIEEI